MEKFHDCYIPEPNSGCFLWLMGEVRGYGKFQVEKRTYLAHRVAYTLAKGEIPPGVYVLHSCDNRACVNPDHLSLGDQKQNMKEMDLRGRRNQWSPSGERNPRAKLLQADVDQIRLRLLSGEGFRSIATKYGMSVLAIKRIKTRETWK